MGVGARTKGLFKNTRTGEVKRFLYNPAGFADNVGTDFSEIASPGGGYPKFQYVKGRAKTISLELFLHDREGKVREYIDFIDQFRPEKSSRFSPPPTLLFVFGEYVAECILEDRQVTYIDFDTDLQPIYAVVRLNLKVV